MLAGVSGHTGSGLLLRLKASDADLSRASTCCQYSELRWRAAVRNVEKSPLSLRCLQDLGCVLFSMLGLYYGVPAHCEDPRRMAQDLGTLRFTFLLWDMELVGLAGT